MIIPTLNEAANLPWVLGRLPEGAFELIIVDGGSTDDTVATAKRLRPDARIVFQDKTGKGNALLRGFDACRGEIVLALDADGSTDPEEIPAFVSSLMAGGELAKGTRFKGHGGSSDITPLRQAGNRVFTWLVNVLFRTRCSDLCYGYVAFWRRCLDDLRVDCDGFEVETQIVVRAAKAGLRIEEVPSFESSRQHGQTNLRTFRDGFRVLRTIFTERFTVAPARN